MLKTYQTTNITNQIKTNHEQHNKQDDYTKIPYNKELYGPFKIMSNSFKLKTISKVWHYLTSIINEQNTECSRTKSTEYNFKNNIMKVALCMPELGETIDVIWFLW